MVHNNRNGRSRDVAAGGVTSIDQDQSGPDEHRRVIQAHYDDETIVVYQAYSDVIADAALTSGKFVPPFSLNRMTWIKTSLLWMAFRSGWATKDGQTRILAITVSRDGFDWALAHSCLTHYDAVVHGTPDEWTGLLRSCSVRVQWDPERDINLDPLPTRAIQIGLAGEAASRYVNDWTREIVDITSRVRAISEQVQGGNTALARSLLPVTRPYSLRAGVLRRIGCNEATS